MAEHLTQDVDPRLAQSVVDSTTGADGVTTLSNSQGVEVAAIVSGEEANATSNPSPGTNGPVDGIPTNDDSKKDSQDNSPTGASGTESSKGADKPPVQKLSLSRKPPAVKSVSLNKAFLSGNISTAPAQGKLSLTLDKGSKGTASGTAGASITAAKPRLVSKMGPPGSRIAGIGQLGGKAGSVPSVWNRNQPPAPTPAKEYTDEELSKHGIHMAERIQTEDSKESKWADIDEDDDDWVPPDTIEWNDGTKVTLEAAEIPKPTISTFEKEIGVVALKEQRASHSVHFGHPPDSGHPPPNQVDHHSFGKPGLIPSMPPPKMPWAAVPQGSFPTPRPMPPPPNHQFSGRTPLVLTGRSNFSNTQPAKEVAVDDFSRPSWRDRVPAQSPNTLFNSETGNFDPVGDANRNREQGRRNSKTEGPPGVRPTLLLQRSIGRGEPEHDMPPQQNRFPGRPEPHDRHPVVVSPVNMGRQRSASILSAGMSDTSSTARQPAANNSNVITESSDDATAESQPPRASQGPLYISPTVAGGDSRFQRMGPPAPQAAAPDVEAPPQEPGENPVEAQKRVMRDAREQARARRLAEEAAAEEEKRQRILKKLAEFDEKMKAEAASKAEQEKSSEPPASGDGGEADTTATAPSQAEPSASEQSTPEPSAPEAAVVNGHKHAEDSSGEGNGHIDGGKISNGNGVAVANGGSSMQPKSTTAATHLHSGPPQHPSQISSANKNSHSSHSPTFPPPHPPSSSASSSPTRHFSHLSHNHNHNHHQPLPPSRYSDNYHPPAPRSVSSTSSSHNLNSRPFDHNSHHPRSHPQPPTSVDASNHPSRGHPPEPVLDYPNQRGNHIPPSAHPHPHPHNFHPSDRPVSMPAKNVYPPRKIGEHITVSGIPLPPGKEHFYSAEIPNEWERNGSMRPSPWAPTAQETHVKRFAMFLPTPDKEKPADEPPAKAEWTANGQPLENNPSQSISQTEAAKPEEAPPAPSRPRIPTVEDLVASIPNFEELAKRHPKELIPGSTSTTYQNLKEALVSIQDTQTGLGRGLATSDDAFDSDWARNHRENQAAYKAQKDNLTFVLRTKGQSQQPQQPQPTAIPNEKNLRKENTGPALSSDVDRFNTLQDKIKGLAGGTWSAFAGIGTPGGYRPVRADVYKRLSETQRDVEDSRRAQFYREQGIAKSKELADNAKGKAVAATGKKPGTPPVVDPNLQVISKPAFQGADDGKPKVSLPKYTAQASVASIPTELESPHTIPTDDEFNDMVFQQEFGSTPTVCLPIVIPKTVPDDGTNQRSIAKRLKDKKKGSLRDQDITSKAGVPLHLFQSTPAGNIIRVKLPGMVEGKPFLMSAAYENSLKLQQPVRHQKPVQQGDLPSSSYSRSTRSDSGPSRPPRNNSHPNHRGGNSYNTRIAHKVSPATTHS
ncbi:hypothetical protein DRE_01852 [Drechslerella stenobrocha 248]|uniref:Uncharacterized protein n=1 Tax=Drechslerella stenobrocha 248 TaxID=1043628 RepID=W7IHB7_9PEZI|nr:hypothetical protein DRE_01852 [Drechslerella stenobrocha 248]